MTTTAFDIDPEPVPDFRASEDKPATLSERLTRGRKTRTEKLLTDKPAKETPPYRNRMFIEPVEELYGTTALFLMPFKPTVATAIAENATKCAEAWDYAARESPAVRRVLSKVLTASVAGKLFAAHLPILMVAMMENPNVAEKMSSVMGRFQPSEDNE